MKQVLYLFITIPSIALAAERPLASALRDLEQGHSEAFEAVEKAVVGVANVEDAQERHALEDRLLSAIYRVKGTETKRFLCRQLQLVASSRSIGLLESLLADPELSHLARAVLTQIQDPDAAASLRRTLAKTSGNVKIGIIHSLGDLQDAKAVRPLSGLLAPGGDSKLRVAAARSLRAIGTRDAYRALLDSHKEASGEWRQVLDSLIAQDFATHGDFKNARKFYEDINRPVHLRLAGLEALIALASQDNAGQRDPRGRMKAIRQERVLMEALQDSEYALRVAALEHMVKIHAFPFPRNFLGILPTLAPEDQCYVMRLLAQSEERVGRHFIDQLLHSPNLDVRRTAVETIGQMGDENDVSLLLECLRREGLTEVARNSLVYLQGEGVDANLLSAARRADASARLDMLSILTQRGNRTAIPVLVGWTRDPDAALRREAIKSLGQLASANDLHALAELFTNPHHPEDLKSIESAILSSFRNIPNTDVRARALISVSSKIDQYVRPRFIRLLGRTGSSETLSYLRQALKGEPSVRRAAIESLSKWSDAAPVSDLLEIAKFGADETEQLIALRGVVDLARFLSSPLTTYEEAMRTARRVEDKKRVLSGIGQARSLPALEMASRFLSDKDLEIEAAFACLQLGNHVRREAPDRVRKITTRILTSTQDQRVRENAERLLDRLNH